MAAQRKQAEQYSSLLAVKLTPGMLEAIHRLAAQAGETQSVTVRRLIAIGVETEEAMHAFREDPS